MLRLCIVLLLCIQVFCALSLITDLPSAKWMDNDAFAFGLNLLQWRARWHGSQPDDGVSSIGSSKEVQTDALQGLVWADPEVEKFQITTDGGLEKLLVESGVVPYLDLLSFRLLPPGVGAQVPGEANTTVFYFSLNGSCVVDVLATGEHEMIERGGSVLVPPGVNHQVRSAEDPAELANSPATSFTSGCTILTVRLPSGAWNDAGRGQAPRAISGALDPTLAAGPASAASPVLRVADTEHLPVEKTAHESDLLSKRVHVRKGLVPGLLQLSVARFAPGAVCEEHVHPTAAEIYVNYSGSGCHVAAVHPVFGRMDHDLTGGKVAVIKPGTVHWAWNDTGGDCQNINLMINDPHEA